MFHGSYVSWSVTVSEISRVQPLKIHSLLEYLRYLTFSGTTLRFIKRTLSQTFIVLNTCWIHSLVINCNIIQYHMIHREQCMAKSVFKCKFHINPRFKFMPKGRRPEGLHWSKGWYGMWYRFWHTLLFLFYIWIKKASFHFHVKFGLRSKTRPLSRFLSRLLYLMAIGDICNDNFARLLNPQKIVEDEPVKD